MPPIRYYLRMEASGYIYLESRIIDKCVPEYCPDQQCTSKENEAECGSWCPRFEWRKKNGGQFCADETVVLACGTGRVLQISGVIGLPLPCEKPEPPPNVTIKESQDKPVVKPKKT